MLTIVANMDFQDVVGQRRMVRAFTAEPEPIGAIALGHDAEQAKRDLRSRRRSLDDVVRYGRW